ncbi:MAG: M20/M25/M40 family metallo-hydrolase [Trueperaceae bacterium]|nr:M20/M25/M40 family metallo-hydrolase [Trueperaceae bacterium]
MSVSATTPRDQQRADLVGLLTQICETPAPTFAEQARGELIASLLSAEGLEPHTDEVGNVIANLGGGQGPRLLVAAHLDTVFGADTDVSVRPDRGPDGKERLKAPGIGDNSASLAVLMHYVRQSQRHGANPERPRLCVAATVGEEGLGDLYGVRHLMKTRADDFDLVLALDGHLGIIVNESVGSKRFEITFTARGGHSWGDYPSPSATHALGDAIAALNKLQVPGQPRSSYNVGQISAGRASTRSPSRRALTSTCAASTKTCSSA